MFGPLLVLLRCNREAGIGNSKQTGGCVPIKLYLQKQARAYVLWFATADLDGLR